MTATTPVRAPRATARPEHWNPRAFRSLLELPPTGGTVLVVGASPRLVRSLAGHGLHVLQVADDGPRPRLPAPDGSVDQVFVPALSQAWRPVVAAELARVLRPGGGAFVGVHHRLRSRRPEALTAGQGRRVLAEAGLVDVQVHAVREDLDSPTCFVPWDAALLQAWYLQHGALPLGRRAVVRGRLSATAARLGAGPLLFRALGLTARAPEASC